MPLFVQLLKEHMQGYNYNISVYDNFLSNHVTIAQNLNLYLVNNNNPQAAAFVMWGLGFLSQNTSTTWAQFENYVNNNKTSFDSDTGDSNDNIEGGYDNTSYENFDFESPQAQWPQIANVIPVSQFVGWRHEKKANGKWMMCMDFAKEQIGKKGYTISNYGAIGQTFQIYREQTGVNLDNLYKGVSYLKYALSNGIPVIVGIDDHSGSHNPETDNTTDHFVVIVGMGTDSNGRYFTFYDNASSDPNQGASTLNKLYVTYPSRKITGITQCSGYRDRSTEYNYIITQIRKSKEK